jgi:capsular polysaccharide biosynthesis protein
MPSKSHNETATLSDYGKVVRRKWRLVVVGILIGLALAGTYLFVTPKTYTATATVNVTSTPTDTATSVTGTRTNNSDVNPDTEAQLVKSAAVTRQAAGGPSALKPGEKGAPPYPLPNQPYPNLQGIGIPLDSPQLPQSVSVTVPANTQLLKIAFSASGSNGAAHAAQGANAYAWAYLAVRGNIAWQTIEQNILATQKTIDRLTVQLGKAASVSDARAITAQRNVLSDELNQLTVLEQTVVPGTLANAAIEPKLPTSPNRILILASGFMLGLLLGLFLAWWAARKDTRIYEADELPERLDLPLLGAIPTRRGASPTLVSAQSRAGQSLARVRNVLLARLPDRRGVFTVAGAAIGTGPDLIAANLAASFARADLETILLVADPTSCAPALLGAPVGPGLAEVLRHDANPGSVLRPVDAVTGLRVLSPGEHLATDVDDLEGAGVGDLIAKLRAEADIVVVLAPATSRGAEAQILASDSDAAVVVVELARTQREQLEEAFQQFEAVGTVVPGAVTMARPGAGPSPFPALPTVSAASRLTTAPAHRHPDSPPASSRGELPKAPLAAAAPTDVNGTALLPSNESPPTRRYPSSNI